MAPVAPPAGGALCTVTTKAAGTRPNAIAIADSAPARRPCAWTTSGAADRSRRPSLEMARRSRSTRGRSAISTAANVTGRAALGESLAAAPEPGESLAAAPEPGESLAAAPEPGGYLTAAPESRSVRAGPNTATVSPRAAQP